MGLDKLRQVLGFAKDAASLGKAFLRHHGGDKDLLDIKVSVIRATNHDQNHIDDRAMERILLHVTANPESLLPSLVESISWRLSKTRDYVVVLKTLFLIHRVLRGNRQDQVSRAFGGLQLGSFWFMRKQDTSSVFLQKYASYLQERLGWIMSPSSGDLEPIRTGDMKEEEESKDLLFHNSSKHQDFIQKVLNFTPIGTGTMESLVQAPLCTLLKESFQVYQSYSREMKELCGKFSDLPRPERARARGVLRKSAQQSQDLGRFYENCRECVGEKTLEYPSVEVIDMECIASPKQSTGFTSISSFVMSTRYHPKFSSRIS